MRASEFIVETAAEEQEIEKLTWILSKVIIDLRSDNRGIIRAVQKVHANLHLTGLATFRSDGIHIKHIVTDLFKEDAINKIIRSVRLVDTRCGTIDAVAIARGGSSGGFSPAGIIYLNMEILDKDSEVVTTLDHELHHALEYYKAIPVTGTMNLSPAAYLRDRSEINARFGQALLDINLEIMKRAGPITTSELPAIITAAFNEHQLSDIFPSDSKKYKRLLSRAYLFYDAQLAVLNSKSVTPGKGFIRTAISKIFAGLL